MKINVIRGGKVLSLLVALSLLVCTFGSAGVSASGQPAKEALAASLAMSEINPAAMESSVQTGDKPTDHSGSLGYVHPYIDPSYLREGTFSETPAQAETGFPGAFSVPDNGMVTGTVRNQTNWGTCWAFAAVGAAESSLYPNDQTTLSPRHLAYFTYHGTANPALPEDRTDGDTFHPYAFNASETAGRWHPWYEYGGNSFMANATLSRIGFQTDAAVPYPERYDFFDSSKLDSYGTPALKDDYLQEYGDVAEGYHFTAPYRLVESNYLPTKDLNGNWNGDAVKKALMDGYSVSVSYASGSYNDYPLSDGSVIIAQQYNGPNRVNINHAVQIVGWNDQIPKEAFRATSGRLPTGDGGWLIRNSWGENWGMDGCFYLSYEDSSLSETCQFIASADQPYDHNYQYDGAGWSTTVGATGNPTKPVYMSNVFTATGDETIQATAFYTTAHHAVYSIQVYTDLKFAGDPASGTPAFSEEQKGTQPYAGYHTVPLELPVNVKKGEKFAVVVKIQNPDADNRARYASAIYPVACELDGYCDGVRCDASIRPGESFISFNGGEWLDLADYGDLQQGKSGRSIVTPANICLKAFTVDGHESRLPLQKAVNDAKKVMELPKYYNASTRDAFDRALANAERLLKQPSAAAAEITGAANALQTATNALNGQPTNLTALRNSITAAEAAKSAAAYLYGGADQKAALDVALQAAQQAVHKTAPTQKEADHAKAALDTAMAALNGAAPVHTAALETSIAAAESIKQTDAYLYECDIKRAALDHALVNAEQILHKVSHTQAEVDHAKNALDLACMVLDGKKQGL
ncbi:lectin like domain-containing protein [Clostridium sp. D33t1_170424_F3]|uniref:lectin like domain-containing protein n=1 Tax=Clostridium sp. D33t1_170424_F3 TaxID=2787099 RepID=UPI0018A8AAC5|nr:lectin like domain-containing protein [Clostridium sp. D33t1_170424_F3]